MVRLLQVVSGVSLCALASDVGSFATSYRTMPATGGPENPMPSASVITIRFAPAAQTEAVTLRALDTSDERNSPSFIARRSPPLRVDHAEADGVPPFRRGETELAIMETADIVPAPVPLAAPVAERFSAASSPTDSRSFTEQNPSDGIEAGSVDRYSSLPPREAGAPTPKAQNAKIAAVLRSGETAAEPPLAAPAQASGGISANERPVGAAAEIAGGTAWASKVAIEQISAPTQIAYIDQIAPPTTTQSLPVRVAGESLGTVAFQVNADRQITVNIAQVLDLFADRFSAEEYALLRGSAASRQFVSLETINAAGIDIHYDAVYDELVMAGSSV